MFICLIFFSGYRTRSNNSEIRFEIGIKLQFSFTLLSTSFLILVSNSFKIKIYIFHPLHLNYPVCSNENEKFV